MPLIGRVSPANRPGLSTWEVADTTERDALTEVAPGIPITSDDIGRVCRVGSAAPYEYYELTGVSPLAWALVGGGGSGSGDVVGPASSTANAIAIYDDTTGKLLAEAPATFDVDGNLVMALNDRLVMSTDQATATTNRLIELKFTNEDAKALIAYVDYNDNPVVWLQAHDYLDFATNNRHQHFSIETAMADGTLTTRFQVRYGTDTVDCEFNNSNLIVGGTGNFTVSNGETELNGEVTVNDGNVRLNSTGTATVEIDRGDSTAYSNLSYRTADTEVFAVGLRAGDSHLHIRNASVTKILVQDGASAPVLLGVALDFGGNNAVNVGQINGRAPFNANALQGSAVATTAPTDGQSLVWNGTASEWEPSTPAGGGDVTGPASSTDNAIVRFHETTGKIIQNSGPTISDAGVLDMKSQPIENVAFSRETQSFTTNETVATLTHTSQLVRVTGGPMILDGIDDSNTTSFQIYADPASGGVQINKESASAGATTQRIVGPGDDADTSSDTEIPVPAGASVGFFYDTDNSRWVASVEENAQDYIRRDGTYAFTNPVSLGGNPIWSRPVRTQTGTGNLLDTDESVLVDSSGGAVSLTLPTPASSMSFTLKKVTTDANTITLVRAGTETIEGASSDLALPGSDATDLPAWSLIYDQPNDAWWVI